MSNGPTLRVVAPWYRWPRQRAEQGRTPRQTRPVIQKYDTAGCAGVFVRDPQLSLRYDDDDRVQEVVTLTSLPRLPREFRDLTRRISDTTTRPTGMRKLFLTTHRRFYLVACEVHCDVAGFPHATREDICQAGFVVRRRTLRYPPEVRNQVVDLLRRIATLSAQIAELDRKAPSRGRRLRSRTLAALLDSVDNSRAERRKRLAALRETAIAELRTLTRESGGEWVREGWIASEFDGVGSWELVDERPQVLREVIYPLYRLVPDRRDQSHDAQQCAMYFGMVPTGDADADEMGVPRFDDTRVYEIWCFTRRHQAGCRRSETPPDCHGPLFWSEPTEPYRLAPHFDLVGTANRPLTVQLPDFKMLEAQVGTLPREKLAPVRMVAPADSSLEFSVNALGVPIQPSVLGPLSLSFAIPLVTIVAMFLLKMFMPIVVSLFGLYWMLMLKIPLVPNLSFDVGARLETLLDPDTDTNFTDELKDELKAVGEAGIKFGDRYSNRVLADVLAPAEPQPRTAALAFEGRVERAAVFGVAAAPAIV